MSDVILPGATLGVLGGGQLGRMFAIAAREMGYRVSVLAPGEDPPAAQVADQHVRADFADLEAVERFARAVDVVTFEFENIHVETAEAAAKHVEVRPAGRVLHTTQNRLREKRALSELGLPVAGFAALENEADLATSAAALSETGGVLKTASWGYDGKGQRRVHAATEIAAAWDALERQPAVLEAWVPFEREVSVVGARSPSGEIALYAPFENAHENHVLDVTLSPARLEAQIAEDALEIARAVLEGMDVIGVLCVEMFALASGELIVNELAPRPHNSGHITIDAHATSQFEQQVRAVCNLPLGSTERLVPAAAMANLLGDLWDAGEPNWATALRTPTCRLHLYGKQGARPGRKMGHLTARGATNDEALERVRAARAALGARG